MHNKLKKFTGIMMAMSLLVTPFHIQASASDNQLPKSVVTSKAIESRLGNISTYLDLDAGMSWSYMFDLKSGFGDFHNRVSIRTNLGPGTYKVYVKDYVNEVILYEGEVLDGNMGIPFDTIVDVSQPMPGYTVPSIIKVTIVNTSSAPLPGSVQISSFY